MSIRYIGSKTRIAERILDLTGDPTSGRFVDAFSGMGSVAAAAADRGWAVTVNDALPSAVAMSVAAVVGRKNLDFSALGGYSAAIAALNSAKGVPGFLHSEYSPASRASGQIERKYFTEANAARLDAMRSCIADWSAKGLITWVEEQLLLADLMSSANSVANISGTYGAFLRDWSKSALRPITVKPRRLPDRFTNLEATAQDVFDLETTQNDVVYYDPPYTKRQYSAYYHVLETIHAGDAPKVGGVTGLRPWQDKASVFCYKTKALEALTSLILDTRAGTILLSYSNEGHVPKDHLVSALSEAGRVTVHEVKSIGRYRPNAGASATGDSVKEYVVEVQPIATRNLDSNLPDVNAVYA